MLKIFKTFGGFVEIPQLEKGCWINVVQPSSEEIERLQKEFLVPADIIRDILDVDERPRYEVDDQWSLIIIRIPVESPNNGIPYYTIPLGIIRIDGATITICQQENEVLPFAQPALYRGQTQFIRDELHFIIKLFLRTGSAYLRFLKHINQQTSQIENEMEKSIRNKELNKLMKMEKCMVYFITSLKSNDIVMSRLRDYFKKNMNDINEDLLEDAYIENKQALDMAQIYSDIQSSMMDAYASVISNNMNVVMKQLTSISIIVMIPTLIASLFGMNVPNNLESNGLAFIGILIVSVIMSYLGIVIFRKKDLF